MDTSKRIVQFAYGAGTFLAAVLFSRLFGSIFGLVGARDPQLLGKDFTLTTLLAGVSAVVLLLWTWRHARIRPLAHEVADELVKVTWPTWDETKTNGRITVAVSIVVALILGVFDWVFGGLTNYILGGT
jgi:preprotein translocase subunit SecE